MDVKSLFIAIYIAQLSRSQLLRVAAPLVRFAPHSSSRDGDCDAIMLACSRIKGLNERELPH